MFDLNEMDTVFHEKRQKVEQALQLCMEALKEKTILYASISYSLFSSGKRIRPLLLISAYETLSSGQALEKALIPACAIELIHTYSLIHDDLPCMDNSDMRRGKPSNHKLYGEDVALLAGDALLTHAFTLLSSSEAQQNLNSMQIVQLIQCLSKHSGIDGMVEGQAFELMQQDLKMENLHYIDEHKTAALFSASLVMGAIVAESPSKIKESMEKLGRSFGHAFQIADDLADYQEGDPSSNIVKLLGREKSIELYHHYIKEVNSYLEQLEPAYTHASLKNILLLMQKKAKL
jgi:geranylgeranyl diphosphate synthase, type II